MNRRDFFKLSALATAEAVLAKYLPKGERWTALYMQEPARRDVLCRVVGITGTTVTLRSEGGDATRGAWQYHGEITFIAAPPFALGDVVRIRT